MNGKIVLAKQIFSSSLANIFIFGLPRVDSVTAHVTRPESINRFSALLFGQECEEEALEARVRTSTFCIISNFMSGFGGVA
jgi:hypothetical protein